ncbi:MAG: orotidine-5'-phosphate decarboxylase [Deltaproteobacteria bacterium]|nr:orotidine-5'-phosphate decarboxylase [Deltaproteobacteria bacterium]
MVAKDRIIFALDVGTVQEAHKWVRLLGERVGWFKVGLELFSSAGPAVVELIKANGMKCFLDLKFHDIPNTVYGAVRSAVKMKADMMTIHISGGAGMIQAALKGAREGALSCGISVPKIIGVSMLTSLNQDDLGDIGIQVPVKEHVLNLITLARENRIDGIVCSPADLEFVRPNIPDHITVITPGIRPDWAAKGDQKRIATPKAAISSGADLLVIGRPISQAENPVEAVERIVREIESL